MITADSYVKAVEAHRLESIRHYLTDSLAMCRHMARTARRSGRKHLRAHHLRAALGIRNNLRLLPDR